MLGASRTRVQAYRLHFFVEVRSCGLLLGVGATLEACYDAQQVRCRWKVKTVDILWEIIPHCFSSRCDPQHSVKVRHFSYGKMQGAPLPGIHVCQRQTTCMFFLSAIRIATLNFQHCVLGYGPVWCILVSILYECIIGLV